MRKLQITVPPGLTAATVFVAVGACNRRCKNLRWSLTHKQQPAFVRERMEEKIIDLTIMAQVWTQVAIELRAAEAQEAPRAA